MSTIGVTIPVGSPTALRLALQLLEASATIQAEIAASVEYVHDEARVTLPAETAPQAGQATGDVELDADGLPWDARIHSDATERKAATGKWKRKRNVSDELVAQVAEELRAGLAVGAAQATEPAATVAEVAPTPTPPAPAAPAPAPVVKVLTALNGIDLDAYLKAGWSEEQLIEHGHAHLVEQAPEVATPPAPPAPAASGEPTNWEELTNWVIKLQAQGVSLGADEIQGIAVDLGLKMLPEIMNRPDLIPQFVAKAKALKGL